MKRRAFAVAAATGALVACKPTNETAPAPTGQVFNWKMVTSWPPNFPGLGTGASKLAEMITKASGGQLSVRVYGGGELVPAFEVFDAVSLGTAEMGHSVAYYWKGKSAAAPFFSAVPFGLNAQEMNGWMYHGGGLELWRELYASFNLVPFPAGNTGVQMAGWFKKEIRSIRDLQGLKMRMPGLGGDVLRKVGGSPVNIPGADLFTALQTGAIDAAEWVGPYNDLAFGLHNAAKFYYYPGWQEPGSMAECMINKTAWDGLPAHLKTIVELCCRAINDDMLADFTTQNHRALAQLVDEHGVEVRKLPNDVIAALRTASEEIVSDLGGSDPFVKRVYDSFVSYREQSRQWHKISEEAFYAARG